MPRFPIATILLIIAGITHAEEAREILPPGFKIENHSAADLSTAWWQWAMSSPDEINPVRDRSGVNCHIGQQGSIWFLAGGFGSSKIKRTCTIPADKSLFFPIVNMVYFPQEENNGYTCKMAKKNAAINNDTAIDLYVDLDGVSVQNPKLYRAKTKKCFNIFEHISENAQAFNAYPSASDGYWIGIKPLKKGVHTLKFGGRYNHTGSDFGRMVQDIEYILTIE